MSDRVVRDELLESDRWLDLPTDTDRLAYIALLLVCDDFGNLEGQPRRMFRFLHKCTQIKTEEACATTLIHLTDADLLRRYEVAGRPFFHIPRFRPHRQYLTRRWPVSPWDDTERKLGKERRVIVRGLAKDQQLKKNVDTTSLPSSYHVAEGVGVYGVDVGLSSVQELVPIRPELTLAASGSPVSPKKRGTRLDPNLKVVPDEWRDWANLVYKLEPERVVRMWLVFRDFWQAKAGKDAVKLDWFKTWCNWVRKEVGDV